MAAFRAAMSSGWAETMTVSPFVWEEVTFSTCTVLRTTSLTWLSHMPHIMPSTFSVV